MDWDDLAYFVCLVEQQTLTKTAETLGVQHSTVARRIERLERTLSLTLFNRLGKRYHLTQEGELLYAQAIEIQKEIHTFERMAVDQNALQGSVIISAPPVLVNELLIKALPAFRKQYPDIVLQLRGEVHISDLHRKEADIALRLHRPTQEDLLIRTVGQVHYGFFAHQDYVEHTPTEQWQVIAFNANKRLLNWLQSVVDQQAYAIVLSSNDLYVTYSCVCEQLGMAILPYFLATKNPNLQPINPITRTVMTLDEIERAKTKTDYLRGYLNDYLVADAPSGSHKQNQEQHQKSMSTSSIALIQTKPLYVVMHPDVRRSARVGVVADWLGTVLATV